MIKFRKSGIIALLLGLVLILAGCLGGDVPGVDDSSNTIMGTVTLDGQGVPDVKVTINENNKITYTGSNGGYEFTDLSDGTYTLHFYKEGVLDKTIEVPVSGGKTVTRDLSLSSDSGETTLQDAKDFVDAVNNNGIQMKTVVNEQADKVATNLTQEVSPYMEGVAMRLGLVDHILFVWEENILENDSYGPGQYTINPDDSVTQEQEYDSSNDSWKWDLTWVDDYGTHNITIKLTNLDNITEETQIEPGHYKRTVDLSEGLFEYSHTYSYDSNFDWHFNFNLSSTSTQTVSWTDYNYYEEVEYDYVVTVPEQGEFNFQGTITDSLTAKDTNGPQVPAVGDVKVNANLSLDSSTDNKSLTFDGSFNSREFDANGYFNVQYSMVTSDTGKYPLPSKIDFEGDASTRVAKIKGGLTIEFIEEQLDSGETIPLPNYVVLDGSYQDLDNPNTSENEHTTTLDGSLEISADYTNYDIAVDESTDNYLPGSVTFKGKFENIGFEPVNLDITVNRTGYEQLNSSFNYTFAGTKYIEGDITIDGEQLSLTANNQDGLVMNLDMTGNTDYSSGDIVGAIKGSDGEIYADIVVTDTSLQIDFKDNTTQSLLY